MKNAYETVLAHLLADLDNASFAERTALLTLIPLGVELSAPDADKTATVSVAGAGLSTTAPAEPEDEPEQEEKPAAKTRGKPRGKSTARVTSKEPDITKLREQAVELLEWLSDDPEDRARVEALLDGRTEPDITGEAYVKFYNSLYDIAVDVYGEENLEEMPRLEV